MGLGIDVKGDIYEGLLEFKLKIADEPRVAVKQDGKEVYVRPAEAGGKNADDGNRRRKSWFHVHSYFRFGEMYFSDCGQRYGAAGEGTRVAGAGG